MLVRRYRALVAALVFFVAVHVVAMATMATLLRGGMDASSFTMLERMRYVAEHPWLWRLGWLPWQLCALSDVLVSVTLWRWLAAREGRAGEAWAFVGLVLNLAASIPEQLAELELVTHVVDLAQSGDQAYFSAYWRKEVVLTGVWGGGVYVLMTFAWMRATARAAKRGAWPLWAELVLLGLFLIAVALTWACAAAWNETASAMYFALAAVPNALAFPLLVLWTVALAARAGELARSDVPDPSDVLFALRWPANRPLGWLRLFASDGARDAMRVLSMILPYPILRSDVTDVVYLNWMIPIERARPFVHPSLELFEVEGKTPFSILSYRHGCFGPALLGPLRRLMPSPTQSNWRLYERPKSGDVPDTVVFLKNVIDHPLYTIGSRLLSDGLPGHLPRAMSHAREGSLIRTRIQPGESNAPDIRSCVIETEERAVPPAFRPLAATYEGLLRALVPQRLSARTHAAIGLRSESLIEIGASLSSVRPARIEGAVASEWLEALVAGCDPLAFVIPEVAFASTGERWSRLE